MGWFWLILLLAAALAGLALALRHRSARMWPVAAVLLLGAVGYGWQGHPQSAGQPAPTPPSSTKEEGALKNEVDAVAKGAQNADGLFVLALAQEQKGDHRMAAALLARAAQMQPDNADIWVAMGNALVLHAGGLLTPAADLAFDRALAIAPDHPGPAFFKGLGLAQAGQYDAAAAIWAKLLARTPKDAPWRADLEQRLAEIAQMTGDSDATAPAAASAR
ncbi:tetratricopeptide repeat protein [Aquisediminimonas sediminicola]|uniref:tetratricopeptide repeat protein n=1 Tax=Alteraquisediminimonas sediminicola TaxID=2676787 RepID=UPI003CCEA8F7